MPNKYLDSVQLGRLITKIKTYVNTVVAGYLPTSGGSITGNLTVSGTITGDVTGDVTGNADTATSATNDGDGNEIASTYLPAVVGAVVAFAGSTSPDGWLLCDGSAVSRTTYAALFAVIGTTYGSGDGSTTFALPNLTNKFIQGSSTAGTVKAAGLPNISGSIGNFRLASGPAASGALDIGGSEINVASGTSGNTIKSVITFNASNSNSIYGNSNTVQPPAVTMRYIIKY